MDENIMALACANCGQVTVFERIPKNEQKCKGCGHKSTPEEPVQYIRDPYIWQLDNECVMRWLCIGCEEERRDDI